MVDVVKCSISALGWKPKVIGGSSWESAPVVGELLMEEQSTMVFSASRLRYGLVSVLGAPLKAGVSSREGAESRSETGELLSAMVFAAVISSVIAGGLQKDRGSDYGLRSKFSVTLVVVMLDLTQGGVLAEGAVTQSMTTGNVVNQLLQQQYLPGTGVNSNWPAVGNLVSNPVLILVGGNTQAHLREKRRLLLSRVLSRSLIHYQGGRPQPVENSPRHDQRTFFFSQGITVLAEGSRPGTNLTRLLWQFLSVFGSFKEIRH
ncbi:hypothetical protein NE237_000866 [Protea cynaroides]|uniref:Uncharacterized protein n=1 Tax=Protea cynaroides TaxID=273540 RepID=A0A9Q0QXJ0_9MAGN|nr:hypothetical protein NE237_000866 [Protea cynaroides]